MAKAARRAAVFWWSAALFFGAHLGHAQTIPLETELRELNRSMGRLVELLQRLVAQQETDLVLRRIELKQQRLIPLEAELRGKAEQREQQSLQLDNMELQIETMKSRAFDAESKGGEGATQAQAMRDNAQQQESYLEQLRRSIAHTDAGIADLDSEIGRLRAELHSFERALGDEP